MEFNCSKLALHFVAILPNTMQNNIEDDCWYKVYSKELFNWLMK